MTPEDLDSNSYTLEGKIRKPMQDIQEEYKLSESIQPYSNFVKTTFSYSSTINMATINQTLNFLHILCGIAGEYIELQNELEKHEDIKEEASSLPYPVLQEELHISYLAAEKELGDLCYYVQMGANLINISLPQINPMFNNGESRAIEDFIDAIKKKIFYKHEVDLQVSLLSVWSQINFIANSVFNKPIEYFILQNKTKLMKRYPLGKFTSQDAQEKKDTL